MAASKYGRTQWTGSRRITVGASGAESLLIAPGHYEREGTTKVGERSYYLEARSPRNPSLWGVLRATIVANVWTLRRAVTLKSPAPAQPSKERLVWTPPLALEDREYGDKDGIGLIVPMSGACPIEIDLHHEQAISILFASPFPGDWEIYHPLATDDPNVPIYKGKGPPRINVPPNSGWVFCQKALI